MNKKFSNKTRGKVWAKVDRYFTWDKKDNEMFTHIDEKTGIRTYVFIGYPTKHGMYVSISKYNDNGNKISGISSYATTMHDVNRFVQIVKLIG